MKTAQNPVKLMQRFSGYFVQNEVFLYELNGHLPSPFDVLVAAFSDRSLNMYALMTSSKTTAARALNPEDIVLEIKR